MPRMVVVTQEGVPLVDAQRRHPGLHTTEERRRGYVRGEHRRLASLPTSARSVDFPQPFSGEVTARIGSTVAACARCVSVTQSAQIVAWWGSTTTYLRTVSVTSDSIPAPSTGSTQGAASSNGSAAPAGRGVRPAATIRSSARKPTPRRSASACRSRWYRSSLQVAAAAMSASSSSFCLRPYAAAAASRKAAPPSRPRSAMARLPSGDLEASRRGQEPVPVGIRQRVSTREPSRRDRDEAGLERDAAQDVGRGKRTGLGSSRRRRCAFGVQRVEPRPTAGNTSSAAHPAKQWMSTRPSSSSRTASDGRRSSCAGQSATHRPGPVRRTTRSRSSSTAAVTWPP